MVLVGNSLVFFKDPKSQTPSNWVRPHTSPAFNGFIPGGIFAKYSTVSMYDVKIII